MEDEYHGDDDVMPNFSVDTMGQPVCCPDLSFSC
eukprot:SAG11_NODE_645_length_7983_cov_5.727596_4_plen_34_part_00